MFCLQCCTNTNISSSVGWGGVGWGGEQDNMGISWWFLQSARPSKLPAATVYLQPESRSRVFFLVDEAPVCRCPDQIDQLRRHVVDMKECHGTFCLRTVFVDVEGTGWVDRSSETGSVTEP